MPRWPWYVLCRIHSSLVSQHNDCLQCWPQVSRKVYALPWRGTLVQMRHEEKRQRLCCSGVIGPGEPPRLHHLGKACWWEWDRKSTSTSSFPAVTWSWKSNCCRQSDHLQRWRGQCSLPEGDFRAAGAWWPVLRVQGPSIWERARVSHALWLHRARYVSCFFRCWTPSSTCCLCLMWTWSHTLKIVLLSKHLPLSARALQSWTIDVLWHRLKMYLPVVPVQESLSGGQSPLNSL